MNWDTEATGWDIDPARSRSMRGGSGARLTQIAVVTAFHADFEGHTMAPLMGFGIRAPNVG